MHEALRQTRSYLMELFEQHGFHPRTDLGQNFLIDLNIVDFIVREANLDENDVVLEIGAGTGGMSTFLAQQAAAVVSVEIDQRMYELAHEVVGHLDNVTLLNCDALKNKNTISPEVLSVVQERLDAAPNRRLKLVANLPYNVATPVISNLVATDLPWERMVVTIQLELAERMTARPGSSDYGALSVWLQSQCRVKLIKRLPPNVFWPRPKVNSAIVKIQQDPARRARIVDREFYQDFLRRLFHLRRKFLRTVLAGMYRKQLTKPQIDAVLTEMELTADTRAERLEPAQLIDLANRLHAAVRSADGEQHAQEEAP